MVLEEYRARLAPYIDRWVRPWLAWSPATLSGIGIGLLVAAAGLALLSRYTTPYLFLAVSVLIFAGGAFDVLDGEVARRTGRTSLRGDFLDHVLDRYGDVALVLGLAVSGFSILWLGLLALVSLLLTSYMGTQAQALGLGRLYRGLLSRADRLLLLSAAAFLEFLFVLPWPWAAQSSLARFSIAGVSLTVFDLLFAYFLVAGQWTALSRARQIWTALGPAPRLPPPPPPPVARPPPRP
ncbi:MAG: CDP-alcohol phosphatidyltransferase family protein [Thermoplasmata archaeon]|nr:CDP-alcohol phosphatidyltransferase family protein [Thermoplasmata archaeon]